MARKGENIYKRKDGRWEARYVKSRSFGKTYYGYVYGKSYREAKEKRAEKMANLKDHQKKTSREAITFEEVSVKWMESLSSIRKPSTLVKYQNQLDNYILPQLGNMKMSEISNEDILSLANYLLNPKDAGGNELSTKSTSDIISRVKTIRKFALMHGYEVGYVTECISIAQVSKPIRVLSLDEEHSLLQYLNSQSDTISLGVTLCLYTGIRLGELCALQWKDFSLENREVYIRRTLQRLQNLDDTATSKTYICISEPKSQCSIRTIPLPDNIMDRLKKEYVSDAYVLTGLNSYIEPRTMENHFKRILSKCSIKDANFHALRHSFATRCVEVGFDIKSLSEILGHANVNITLNRYVHPTIEMKRKNMEKLSSVFSVK